MELILIHSDFTTSCGRAWDRSKCLQCHKKSHFMEWSLFTAGGGGIGMGDIKGCMELFLMDCDFTTSGGHAWDRGKCLKCHNKLPNFNQSVDKNNNTWNGYGPLIYSIFCAWKVLFCILMSSELKDLGQFSFLQMDLHWSILISMINIIGSKYHSIYLRAEFFATFQIILMGWYRCTNI